jgi:putative polymerase
MNSAATGTVLISAVCFNALLSIINGHVIALQRAHVIFTEVFVYVAALTILIFNADRKMLSWFLLAVFITLNGLLLSVGNSAFNPKDIRDVLVIPIFVMLGMAHRAKGLMAPIVILQTIVFAVALLEAIRPDVYSEIFQVLNYYVNTRDFSTDAFWNTESNLFLSATRPGERFFGFVDLHRLSSVFLEPVSLGNYCVIISILVMASWRELTYGARWYLIGSTLILLVGCDGRLAALSLLIISVALIFLRNVSSRWSVFYLPLVLFMSAVFVASFDLDPTNDNFSGRLAGSISTLSQIGLRGLAGLDTEASGGAADSGIAYFVLTQSVVGVIVIWLSVCLLPVGRNYATRLYVHGTTIFIPLTLMVSYSFFSIKVASLIWFAYGYFFLRDFESEPSPVVDGPFLAANEGAAIP